MALKNTKIQKFVATFLVIAVLAPSFVIFSTPKKVEAQFTDFSALAQRAVMLAFSGTSTSATVTNTALNIKDFIKTILTETLKIVARRVLAEMTRQTVQWINTGRGGEPLFLTNTSQFFEDMYKTEIKELSWAVGWDSHRFPYSKDYIIGLMQVYKQDAYYNMQSSLSRVVSDPTLAYNYRTQFGVSGWDGLVQMTQNMADNALGFPYAASDVLDRQIQTQNKKISDALLHGQGFLPPQICVSNPNYDNDIPPENRPSFDPSSIQPLNQPPVVDPNNPASYGAFALWQQGYNQQISVARFQWESTNVCPGGLTNTTPGSVAASEVMKAVNIPQQHAWISSALGNSLTAVFDALANKLINKGLRYVAKKTNLTPQPDTFSYGGETFGQSPSDGTTAWYNYPDEIVELDKFKKEISGKSVVKDANDVVLAETIGNCNGQTINDYPNQGDSVTCSSVTTAPNGIITGSATVTIANTTTSGTFEYVPGVKVLTALELRLIDDTQPGGLDIPTKQILDLIHPSANNQNPGLIQVIDRLWTVAFGLDQCIPGPNKGWEERLDKERDRVINARLMQESGKNDDRHKAVSNLEADLRLAVSTYKDWVTDKMNLSLPNSILYVDAIRSLNEITDQEKGLADKRREKSTALARISALEAQLSIITTQPAKDSPGERRLVQIVKQYRSIQTSVSNLNSVETTQGDLALATEKLSELRDYEVECGQARKTAGWMSPNPSGIANPKLDYVDSLPDRNGVLQKVRGLVYQVPMRLAPFAPYGNGTFWGPDDHTGKHYDDDDTTDRNKTVPYVSTGVEIEQFCTLPLISGRSHSPPLVVNKFMEGDHNGKTSVVFTGNPFNFYVFRNPAYPGGSPGFEDLLMINGLGVFHGTDWYALDIDIGDQRKPAVAYTNGQGAPRYLAPPFHYYFSTEELDLISKGLIDPHVIGNCDAIYGASFVDYKRAGDAGF